MEALFFGVRFSPKNLLQMFFLYLCSLINNEK